MYNLQSIGDNANGFGGLGFSGVVVTENDARLGIYVKSQAVRSREMLERYRLLSVNKRVLHRELRRGHSILGCRRVVMSGASDVMLSRYRVDDGGSIPAYEQGLHAVNVVTCKSVWVCPVCSYRLAGARADEIRRGIHAHMQSGGDVYMLTLTFAHGRYDSLSDIYQRLKAALTDMWQQWSVKSIMAGAGMVGRVTSTELTYGDRNGWHPHQHILLFGRRGLDLQNLRTKFARNWLLALSRNGLSGLADVACSVQPASAVSDYLTKMAGELSMGNVKTGRGDGHYSPMELLAMCANSEHYSRLWRDYYHATRGSRALVWSRGLKRRLGVVERSDDEIMDMSTADYEPVLWVVAEDWSGKLGYEDYGYVRVSCLEDVIALLDARGCRYGLIDCPVAG
jgi:hypothetical protein